MASTETSSTSSVRGPSTRHIGTVTKWGRTYLSRTDVSVPYPLPVDLVETHRQIMFAQLTSLVYDTPILSKDLLNKPPLRVLELGCDTGWWSATCHQYFKARGYDVEFVGMDVKQQPGIDEGLREAAADFSWEYVQHDLNQFPWPFPDGSFDLVMARNIALALDGRRYSETVQEYVRVLRPGGTLELWEHDTTIRSLRRPDAPGLLPRRARGQGQGQGQGHAHAHAHAGQAGGPEDRQHAADLALLGLYPASEGAAFRPAASPHAAQYNAWLTAGLADLELPTMPCSYIDAMFRGHLVDGSEDLETENMVVKRIAIPLSTRPMSWEQQRLEVEAEAEAEEEEEEEEEEQQQQQQQLRGQWGEGAPGALGPDQEAIRRTALENFVGMVEAFGPLLQEKSGMGQADWDAWLGRAKRDWLEGGGFSFGECMELGAWSLKKKAAH